MAGVWRAMGGGVGAEHELNCELSRRESKGIERKPDLCGFTGSALALGQKKRVKCRGKNGS